MWEHMEDMRILRNLPQGVAFSAKNFHGSLGISLSACGGKIAYTWISQDTTKMGPTCGRCMPRWVPWLSMLPKLAFHQQSMAIQFEHYIDKLAILSWSWKSQWTRKKLNVEPVIHSCGTILSVHPSQQSRWPNPRHGIPICFDNFLGIWTQTCVLKLKKLEGLS